MTTTPQTLSYEEAIAEIARLQALACERGQLVEQLQAQLAARPTQGMYDAAFGNADNYCTRFEQERNRANVLAQALVTFSALVEKALKGEVQS